MTTLWKYITTGKTVTEKKAVLRNPKEFLNTAVDIDLGGLTTLSVCRQKTAGKNNRNCVKNADPDSDIFEGLLTKHFNSSL